MKTLLGLKTTKESEETIDSNNVLRERKKNFESHESRRTKL